MGRGFRYSVVVVVFTTNGPGRQELRQGRQGISCSGQSIRDYILYSDLLQAIKGKHLMALGSQR